MFADVQQLLGGVGIDNSAGAAPIGVPDRRLVTLDENESDDHEQEGE